MTLFRSQRWGAAQSRADADSAGTVASAPVTVVMLGPLDEARAACASRPRRGEAPDRRLGR
jgi:hypothetical protein